MRKNINNLCPSYLCESASIGSDFLSTGKEKRNKEGKMKRWKYK